MIEVCHGDAVEVMASMQAASVDAIVCDPPYGLEFMGRAWDRYTSAAFADFSRAWAAEAYRVLKPGGHLLAFGGTRTWHRLTCGIEDAGFEIRDTITWLYGSGFPKSLDVSKAIDKAAGVTREVVGLHPAPAGNRPGGASLVMSVVGMPESAEITVPATEDARRWQGWGTALKPASEPIVVARKPLAGTVAQTVLEHGTGALNIDGCRVGNGGQLAWAKPRNMRYHGGTDAGRVDALAAESGRWPPNVALSEDAAAELGETSRFFPTFRYQAKAPARERPRVDGVSHPTVKPLELMRWLVRLVTPPGGRVLDPFAGSGTTAEACLVEGFECVAIEREATYIPLIDARLARAGYRRDLAG